MTEARRKFRNRSFCMLEPDLIESEAFLGLSGKAAVVVLIRFHQKAHRKNIGKKRQGLRNMVITNNGEIVFPYAEAKELGISKKTFHRVIRELVEQKGFIDVADPGDWHQNWFMKRPQRYGISERWRSYGTPQYQAVKLPRILPNGVGFQKGNRAGQKTKVGVTDDTQLSVVDDTQRRKTAKS